jgi:hypothetical protein
MILGTGNERFSFALSMLQLILAVPALVYVGLSFGPVEIAATTTGLAAIYVLVAAANVHRAVPVTFRQIMSAFLSPFVAACFMVAVVQILHVEVRGFRGVTLALDVIVGAISYSVVLLATWRLRGRPAGVEKKVFEYLQSFVSLNLTDRRETRR